MAWYIVGGTLIQTFSPSEFALRLDIEWDSEYIALPRRVRIIGKNALGRCAYLRRVTLPDSLEEIGERAFWGCSCLEELTLPEGVESIGDEAFAWCTNLKRINLPRSLRHLGGGAFKGCTALREVRLAADHPTLRLEKGLLLTHDGTLLCALYPKKQMTLPDDVRRIADSAFAGCVQTERIVLNGGLEEIGKWAFSGCTSLKEISVPQSLRKVGYRAFEECTALTDIALPDELEEMGEMPFGGCTNLSGISLAGRFVEGLDGELVKQLRYIRALSAPASVGMSFRKILCVSYAEQEERYPEAVKSEYFELIRKNAARLRETAFEHPVLLHLMCREGLISARLIDSFMDKAEESGDVELTARLLDYQANVLTFEKIWQARERQERIRSQQDDMVFERAAARMDNEGIRGLNFAAAGKFQTFENRAALKKFLAKHGAALLPSVSAKVDYLLVNQPDDTSSAVARAIDLGIEMMTEVELMSRVKEI